ncbi:MAG: DUF454 domain-containing protein [Rhodoferax sp.]|nr:MAG: DUF454 domain-containing protein [Rhodoferax sp.]
MPNDQPTSEPPASQHSAISRALYKLLALLSLGLGVLGVFLPVLPTTPFILLAAWAATRGSPRLLTWLENHPAFGQMLRDWRRGGVVSRKAKWSATIVMASSALIILVLVRKPWVQFVAIGTMACVLAWLWRRPEVMPMPESPTDS